MQNHEGLYHPQMEHDACGIGCVASLDNQKSYEIIDDGIRMMENMEHRGGKGSEPESGDGAGIMVQIPHDFFKVVCREEGIELPEYGQYGVGMLFFPQEDEIRAECKEILNKQIEEMGMTCLGYRSVPVDEQVPGKSAIAVMPVIEQVFVTMKEPVADLQAFERKLFVLRNYSTHYIGHHVKGNDGKFYATSFSHKLIVYKGQLRTDQVRPFYKDLQDQRFTSALALVHSRFSTNTFPNWKLAQPFRYLAHNGEINTIRGNVNKMKSKEALMKSSLFTDKEMEMLLPVTDPTHSDSANLDCLVEMLVLSGRSLPHVLMMLVPEAWQDNPLMDVDRKAFFKFHASLMEPWDGPAALLFTDGKLIGGTLDRNGLRPCRYCVTRDNKLIMASEAGTLGTPDKDIVMKGRLQPGRMFLADLEEGKIITDEEIKSQIASRQPYVEWIKQARTKLRLLPDPLSYSDPYDPSTLRQRQHAYGFTSEDLHVILGPMSQTGTEPVGSMGADTPLAVLSDQSQHISNYFKQLFAQVSNPPIDPIRERSVMSLFTRLGQSLNMLEESPEHCRQVHISQPVLLGKSLEKVKRLEKLGYTSRQIDCLFVADGKPGRLQEALDRVCEEALQAVEDDIKVLILSDKNIDENHAPIPSLMSVGAVHHHLVNHRLRTRTSLVVEGGDIRETHHFATVIGYGASAIYPYMAFESIRNMHERGMLEGEMSLDEAFENYIKAINYGLLKVMSKMGISTLQSYQSAQIFEAIGLGEEVIEKCFSGTISRIKGIGFDHLAKEVIARHRLAFPVDRRDNTKLEVGGIYQWKRRGEVHLFNPETIHLLQYSTKRNDFALYKKFAEKVNDQARKAITLRSLFAFKKRKPIPIEEVEPRENIFKRFATGAMSFGSISHEAHSTLAIAMNRIGGKSNSGEGGEDEIRFQRKPNGDWERSAIKQVASGRFGVTSHYLANAAELQIKMAQGAKPGEGGQLPGHKVDDWIGRVRHSTPGVGLISPPPHHDIYSIEDLAQLIYDLKNANREARINVKLVSEIGVGTVAAGVSKGRADVVLISGSDGGTGASPISSIRHAGLPWELGLSEAHQTLVRNNLRDRITVQVDGQIRTGRDLAIATLLGAEEWGVSTAALVVEGCIMMRKCHMNTCPVGIATQNPELRKLFSGDPDHVVNYFTFLAEDLREIMAELGFRTVDEMVGQADVLTMRDNIDHWKIKELDLSPVFYKASTSDLSGVYKQIDQDHELDQSLDLKLLEMINPSLMFRQPTKFTMPIRNINRAVGAIISNEISKKYEGTGLPEDTVHVTFNGSAGQSFGAFLAPGVTFELIGEANDYFGKGMSGGKLLVYPAKDAGFKPSGNIIVGNVCFYGATSGEAYIRGLAGERFCVRNSGVKAVVEGVGDHGCEYMTGGTVVILGPTGKNFAAGMSGGVAYVYDIEQSLPSLCNMGMVSFDEMDFEDEETLRSLISNHARHTGSKTASFILKHWKTEFGHFKKVMPNDYKAVLMKRKKLEKVAI